MAESSIQIDPKLPKKRFYEELCAQLRVFMEGESNLVTRMATVASVMAETKKFLWFGFYLVDDSKKELVLGPFTGPLACFRIKKGRGVCGSAWAQDRPLLVPNVDEFPGHIACSSLSKSEIVIPVYDKQKRVLAVMDVDHVLVGGLNEEDLLGLRSIAEIVAL